MNLRLVAVAVKHCGESRSRRVEIERVQIVQHVKVPSRKGCDFGLLQPRARAMRVDIASDRSHRSDLCQFAKYLRIAYVAEMQDMIRASQQRQHFRPKQAVRIRNHADDHLKPHLDARVRVKIVAQRVAKEVEAEHGERHGEGREENQMG